MADSNKKSKIFKYSQDQIEEKKEEFKKDTLEGRKSDLVDINQEIERCAAQSLDGIPSESDENQLYNLKVEAKLLKDLIKIDKEKEYKDKVASGKKPTISEKVQHMKYTLEGAAKGIVQLEGAAKGIVQLAKVTADYAKTKIETKIKERQGRNK
jgi:hypothetical protein